jgi:DNA polymerase
MPQLPTSERTNKLKAIRDQILGLTTSPLYAFRTENGYLPVIGEGSHEAKIMFIGEAPGRNEAKTGRPFCGAAGKVLDELLVSAGIARESVYVTNIVKDRPPENRDPLPEEIKVYGPFLDQQIEIIEPQIIATLGRYSTKYILEKFGSVEAVKTISQLHGKLLEVKASYGAVKILPLYHPAATIYNRSLIDDLKTDFQQLKDL